MQYINGFRFVIVFIVFGIPSVFAQSDNNSVKFAGSMRETMINKKITASIDIADLTPGKTLFGIGPLEFMDGEIMLFEGTIYVAKINSREKMQVTTPPLAGAPFFVYTYVENWKEVPLTETFNTTSELEALIEKLARKNKVDMTKPFPFLLKGTADAVRFHVLENPAKTSDSKKVFFDVIKMKADFVGFFSLANKGDFLHHSENTHIHVISTDRKQMGHVDKINSLKGTLSLYIPASE